jgi:Na+/proline symporter
LAKAALGLASEQATLMAIGVAIFGYFCVLLGGYMTLFRTDIFQLILVILMAMVFGVVLLINHSAVDWGSKLLPKPGFWKMPFPVPDLGLYAVHFFIALIMGAGLLLASPDTWKRVFQVNKKRPTARGRVLTFVGVGILPYVLLLPFAIILNPNVDCGHKPFVLPAGLSNEWLFMFIAMGLAASFLSSFNSALLGSVHVSLIAQRHNSIKPSEESRFYWLMVTLIITISGVFSLALWLLNGPSPLGLSNPWLLGTLIMGAYAIIAGILLGTRGRISRLRKDHLLWIFATGIGVWSLGLYFFRNYAGLSRNPSLCSVNSTPIGVALCIVITALSALFALGGPKNVRRN